MKKRMCVYFFLFTVSVFHFSIPNIVFGQLSDAQQVFEKYKELLTREDVQKSFPSFLRVFKRSDLQNSLSPGTIKIILDNPLAIRNIDDDIDNNFLFLLGTEDELKMLFREEQFYAVFTDPGKIEEFTVLIESQEDPDPDPEDRETPDPQPPKPTTLSIVSGYGQMGKPGKALSHPFVVEVRDQYGAAFSGAIVSFHIAQGGGRLSSKTARTVNNGRVERTFTLGSKEGVNVVEVTLADISSSPKVFFTAWGEQEPVEPPPERSADPRASVPNVSIPYVEPPPERSADPPVYWIEDNAIYYQPAGGDNNKLLLKPQGGTLTGGLAVDMKGERIYWTEKSNNEGRIRSANLEGKDVMRHAVLKPKDGVPRGVAVHTNGNSVYWTTSLGKIQHINVTDPTNFSENVSTNQKAPKTHIAFDEDGGLYWTEPDGIKKRNKKGLIVEVSGDKLGGIAVADGKVYWTEQTGNQQGVVRWKKINGPGGKGKFLDELVESVPKGIAVDAEGDRIYWTTSLGEIQSKPVPEDGETVVRRRDNSASASGIALGNGSSIPSGPAAAPAISSIDPQESTLLANYPNPFNPETWIPYQLSESAEVNVSIYAVNGSLVRTLDLGHQPAGIYQSRSRAAYWDGRNELGERVASGLYFYTLTARDFTATRKMLIRK